MKGFFAPEYLSEELLEEGGGSPKHRLRGDDLVWRAVEEGEVVILDLRSSEYFTLNGSGSVLWQRLADGATTGELSAALMETYGVTAERAGADVKAFLRSCADARLLDPGSE